MYCISYEALAISLTCWGVRCKPSWSYVLTWNVNPTFMVERNGPFPVSRPRRAFTHHTRGPLVTQHQYWDGRCVRAYIINSQGLFLGLDQLSFVCPASPWKVTPLLLEQSPVLLLLGFLSASSLSSSSLPSWLSLFHFLLTPKFLSEQGNKSLHFSSHSTACNFREIVTRGKGRELKNHRNS